MSRETGSLRMFVLLFLLSCALAANSVSAVPDRSISGEPLGVPPWGDWLHYHNYTEIVDTILYLNETYPYLVDVFPIGESWLNKTIYCVRLTNENITRAKPEVLFVGYHHAREPITSELALYFLVDTTGKYGINTTVTQLLDWCQIYVLVTLNVDGYAAVEANEWHRKTAQHYDEDADGLLDEDPPDDEDGDGFIEDLYYWDGITYEFIRWEGVDDDDDGRLNEDWIGGADINRNYEWDLTYAQGGPEPGDETYRGPTPFSEPETQAMRDLALAHSFRYALSFHSGTSQVIGRKGRTMTDETAYREVTLNLSALTGAPWARDYYGGYPTGMWEDWMYGNRSTIALTCEIYGNDSAWATEPGPEPNTYWEKGITQFFSPSWEAIEETALRWMPAFYYVANRSIAEAYDAAITKITPEKTALGQGYSAEVNVTVTNQGRFTEDLVATLYANSSIIGMEAVTLASRQTATIVFHWNSSGFGMGVYNITAEVSQVAGENDMRDNSLTCLSASVVVPGDVDGNHIVNMIDIYSIALHFGAIRGTVDYVPNYDIEDNGMINMLDLYKAAINYGQTET